MKDQESGEAEGASQSGDMHRPLLPPRGLFVPTSMLFDGSLPAAVWQTWIQLRALAWGRQETPALSLSQISNLLDKKQSTLYGHMRLLQSRGALRWRTGGKSKIIFVFPQDDELSFSGNLEKPDPPLSSVLNLNLNTKRREFSTFQVSGKLESRIKPQESASAEAIKAFVDILAQVTGMQAELNYPRLARCAGRLLKAGYSGETIASLYAWQPSGQASAWYARDWRGQKGQRPTPEQIEQTVAGLTAPPTNRSTTEDILRRLAEQEGIDFDELKI